MVFLPATAFCVSSMESNEEDGEFISGVVEGFYGRPWTFDQRKELFVRLKKLGLKFYLYAPKDDIKHRALWRELYIQEELDNLRSLITCAKEKNVVFIYALSPGLDMVFSSTKEVDMLKKKIKQVFYHVSFQKNSMINRSCSSFKDFIAVTVIMIFLPKFLFNQLQIADLGCIAFALLFDDIDPEIRPADKSTFQSFAHAQVTVANEIFTFLNEPKYFLLCPTEYAASRAVPTVDKSCYLSTLGNKLNPAIDIMWTGPKVISKVITTHSIRVVTNVLRRKPIIWDNIHANDYDQRRLFLGPYDGRPIHLYTHLRGILTNPNCEFESNFIAIHTLSTWIKCARVTFFGEDDESATDNKDIEPMEDEPIVDSQSESKDSSLDKEDKTDSSMETDTELEVAAAVSQTVLPKSITILKAYNPEEALKLAATEWLKEFTNPKNVIFSSYAKSGPYSVVNNSTTVQSTASLPGQTNVINTTLTQTNFTSSVLKQSVKIASAPSPVKVAKEKSRNKIKQGTEAETSSSTEVVVGEDMEVVETKTDFKDDITKPKHELPFRLTVEDVLLLVDFFYLPHQHGKRALQILNEFKWLKANSIKNDELSDTESTKKVSEWKERAKKFHEYVENVSSMFLRLSDTPNRAVLYDLYPYIWDVKEVVLLLDSFINWLDSKTKKRKDKSFIPDDPEPWVIRGGICGEMQRLLPMLEGGSDLFTQGAPQVPTASVYTIRPYTAADKDELYKICLSTCDDGQDGHDLFPGDSNMAGDRFIGPYLSICPETVFVVEDKFGLCGYGIAAADGRSFYEQYKNDWLPKMCEKYSKPCGDPNDFLYSEQIADNFHNPSIYLPDELYNKYPAHVRIDLLSRTQDLGIGKRLLACILSVLKSEGCRGVYVEIASTNRDALNFYSRLGFSDVPSLKDIPDDIVLLGRSI